MSTTFTSLVWEIDFPTHTQKLIMLRLADYANNQGESIFPSIEHLATSANSKKRIVQYALGALEECKLTERCHVGGSGKGDTNKWRLNIDLICKLAAKEVVLNGDYRTLGVVENKGANIAPYQAVRVQKAILRVQPTTPKGATDCTQSLMNHQIEPLDAHARAKSDDLGCGKVESLAAIHITDHDIAWSAWIAELKSRGEYKLTAKAEIIGSLIVSNRWPLKTSPLPTLPKLTPDERKKIASAKVSARMVGDAEDDRKPEAGE